MYFHFRLKDLEGVGRSLPECASYNYSSPLQNSSFIEHCRCTALLGSDGSSGHGGGEIDGSE
jgi:hypothetical protein